jgi:dihydroorotase-like cyclic amidohydrolase
MILIRGGTVVNHDHSWRTDVLVDGDKIVGFGPSLDAPAGTEVIDAGGCYVMPGGIDPHTHLELGFMGSVSADDFEWGTKAALAGGTTMVVDFCIPDPGQSMLAAYQDWRRKSEKAACDYGFHMAVTSWSKQVFDEMETVVKTYGINTFKHFMAYKGWSMTTSSITRSRVAPISARCRWFMPRMATSSRGCRKPCSNAASPVPKVTLIRGRLWSRAKPPTAPS